MNVSVSVKADGIDDGLKHLRKVMDGIWNKQGDIVRELCEVGANEAWGLVPKEDGELANSIHVERVTARAYSVVADSPHAVYAEFGTGVVGANSSYPADRPGWVSEPLSRTDPASLMDDGETWVYYDEDIGGTRITRGQVPSAFMAQAARKMREELPNIARKVMKG